MTWILPSCQQDVISVLLLPNVIFVQFAASDLSLYALARNYNNTFVFILKLFFFRFLCLLSISTINLPLRFFFRFLCLLSLFVSNFLASLSLYPSLSRSHSLSHLYFHCFSYFPSGSFCFPSRKTVLHFLNIFHSSPAVFVQKCLQSMATMAKNDRKRNE